MTDKHKPEIEESNDTSHSLIDDLKQLEDARLAALNSLKAIESLRHSLLRLEAERLTEKFGKDHPRVQQLQAHIIQASGWIKTLLVTEMERAEINVAEVEEQDVLIHGRVVDDCRHGLARANVYIEADQDVWVVQGKVLDEESNRGIRGVIISVYNNDDRSIEPLGATITDDRGHYEITFTDEDFFDAAGGYFYLGVLHADERTFCSFSKRLQFESGRADVFNIVICQKEDDTKPDK